MGDEDALDAEFLGKDWRDLEDFLARFSLAPAFAEIRLRMPFNRWESKTERERLKRNFEEIENVVNRMLRVCTNDVLHIPFPRPYDDRGYLIGWQVTADLYEIEKAVSRINDDCVGVRPILGGFFGRTQFPPGPEHPGVYFQRYDPDTPAFLSGAGQFSEVFRDYNVWAGWNEEKTMSVIGLTYDTTAIGPPYGGVPRLERLITVDEDLSTWSPDITEPFIIPPAMSTPQRMRFIPRTDDVVFMATVGSHLDLFRLNTASMTADTLYSDLFNYAYSYDGDLVALDLPIGGVRVFNHLGSGVIGSEISTSDVFGFPTAGFGFTDNSRYLFAWDGGHHVVHNGTVPFAMEWSYPTNIGAGLFGPEPASISQITAHPFHLYFHRASAVSLGLGGVNSYSQFLSWDGDFVASGPASSESPERGDWSQDGGVWIGTDGGRDPYGGIASIVKTGSWTIGGDTRQEFADIRLRPFH